VPARLFVAVAVAVILAVAGFALLYLPWHDKRALLTTMRPLLEGSTIGAFVGGLLVHRHFGLGHWRGMARSAAAYFAAVAIGGFVGGPIALPSDVGMLNAAASGAPMALLFALGIPLSVEIRPFWGLAISAVAIVTAHAAGRPQHRYLGAETPRRPAARPLCVILMAPFLAFAGALAWESLAR
jgi:hypothetical protein